MPRRGGRKKNQVVVAEKTHTRWHRGVKMEGRGGGINQTTKLHGEKEDCLPHLLLTTFTSSPSSRPPSSCSKIDVGNDGASPKKVVEASSVQLHAWDRLLPSRLFSRFQVGL